MNDKDAIEAMKTKITVKQGCCVVFLGILGSLLAIVPSVLLLPSFPCLPTHCELLLPIIWACFVGWPVTFYWSKAIHERIKDLRLKLIKEKLFSEDELKQDAGRLPWMPAWIGIFERAFYALLIGLNVTGGFAFIGAWVAIKLAGGWQVWSKGSTYGRAVLFAGLLGNAMSLSFGLISGIVIEKLLNP
jgi:hypothetical protein